MRLRAWCARGGPERQALAAAWEEPPSGRGTDRLLLTSSYYVYPSPTPPLWYLRYRYRKVGTSPGTVAV